MVRRSSLSNSCARGALSATFALLTAVVAPSRAFAQATATAPTVSEAEGRALFQRAVTALEESRFSEAAALFEESYQRNPSAVVLFNLAFAYRGLGRYRDAVAAVERYLQDPGNTPADRVEAARVELDRLRAALARVSVQVSPSNAMVLVDGRPVTAQGGPLVLDPGRRVIEVSRDGFRPERRELVLAQGSRESLTIALTVIDDAARLRVEPSVREARVTIDGAFVGTGTVERPMRMGVHRVVISAAGYSTLERTVRVGGTGLVRVDAILQRPRANPWPWLGPTIAVVAVTGLVVGGYFIADANRPIADPVRTPDAWGDPVF